MELPVVLHRDIDQGSLFAALSINCMRHLPGPGVRIRIVTINVYRGGSTGISDHQSRYQSFVMQGSQLPK